MQLFTVSLMNSRWTTEIKPGKQKSKIRTQIREYLVEIKWTSHGAEKINYWVILKERLLRNIFLKMMSNTIIGKCDKGKANNLNKISHLKKIMQNNVTINDTGMENREMCIARKQRFVSYEVHKFQLNRFDKEEGRQPLSNL